MNNIKDKESFLPFLSKEMADIERNSMGADKLKSVKVSVNDFNKIITSTQREISETNKLEVDEISDEIKEKIRRGDIFPLQELNISNFSVSIIKDPSLKDGEIKLITQEGKEISKSF